MSKIFEAEMVDCTFFDKISVSDGRGSYDITYKPGAQFLASFTMDNSTEARIGEAQGVLNVYTITTKKAVNLQYHDVLRRETDGKIFRVKSDGDDFAPPAISRLNMRQVSAEEWELPVKKEG